MGQLKFKNLYLGKIDAYNEFLEFGPEICSEIFFEYPNLDMYNRKIISYTISEHPVLNQILDMVNEAFLKIPDDTNRTFHSDQG